MDKTMNISIFDAVLLIIAVSIIIKVTVKGFISEFFSMAAFFAGLAGAVWFYRPLATHLKFDGLSQPLLRAIAFFILFIAVFIAVKTVQMLIAAIFQNEILRSLDHALGFFLGIFEAYIVIVIVLTVFQLQPFINVDSMLNRSVIARILTPLLQLSSDELIQAIQHGI